MNEKDIYIEFRGLDPYDDYCDIINLFIENKRGEQIWVTLNDVCVNQCTIELHNAPISVAAGSRFLAVPNFSFLVIEEQLRQYGIESADALEFDLEIYGPDYFMDQIFKSRVRLNLKGDSPEEFASVQIPVQVQDVKIEGYPYVGWALKKANVRKAPSSASALVGELSKNEEIAIYDKKTDSKEISWYEIRYRYGEKGFVRSDLLEVKTEVDGTALFFQQDAAVMNDDPISLSIEQIRSEYIHNLGTNNAWECREIKQNAQNYWSYRIVNGLVPDDISSELHYRITENGQVVIALRTNTKASKTQELIETAKLIHDGSEISGQATRTHFDYEVFQYHLCELLRIFVADLDYGMHGDRTHNFIEHAVAIGYEDNFTYGFDSDAFADGYGDHFIRVGDYEICFSVQGTQLELALRKRGAGPGAGKTIE